MIYKKWHKKFLSFSRKNYFLLAIFSVIFIVGLIAMYRLFLSPPTYIYVKVKVGQGFWWATTSKPSIWMANSIKNGDKSFDLLGKTQAEILTVRRYPGFSSGQFEIYATLRLKVTRDKSGTYTFNRNPVTIGSPIEIPFPRANLTGSIVDLNPTSLSDTYTNKIIYLVNQGGYNKDTPYKWNTLKIGDSYFDGEEKVFEVLDKDLEKNIWTISNVLNGQGYEQPIDTTQNIVVKAKVRVRKIDNEFYYGGDYKVYTNASIPFSTQNYFFENFLIRKID